MSPALGGRRITQERGLGFVAMGLSAAACASLALSSSKRLLRLFPLNPHYSCTVVAMVAIKATQLVDVPNGAAGAGQVSSSSSKPLRLQASHENTDPVIIIPGLPPSLAYMCLARVPRQHHFSMLQVCKAWRRTLFTLRTQMSVPREPWIYLAFCPNVKVLTRCKELCPLPYHTWLEAYDPSTNIWHNLGPFPGLPPEHTLKGFAFVSLADKLYAIGGMLMPNPISSTTSHDDEANENNITALLEVIRSEVLVFNCTTRQWSTCASMSTPRVNFACTVCKGRIYVAGGRTQPGQEKGVSSAEVYIPETDRWVALHGMSTGRYKCVGVTNEEKIHVIGGFAGPEESDIYPFNMDRSSVDVFHPQNGEWTLIRGMWQLDVPPNQIVSLEGRLYSSGDALNTWKGRIEEYDMELNMWKIVEGSWLPMTHPEECHKSERCYLTMAPIGHCLYFLGGYRLPSDPTCSSLQTVYVFDTMARDAESQWRLVEPMQHICKELCSHCCVVDF